MRSEVKLSEGEFPVTTNDGSQATVTIEGINKQTIVLHSHHSHDHHSFAALLNDARRGVLPGWAKQVAPLTARIEAVFAKERAAGKDPHIRYGVSDGEAFYEDLRQGTRLSVPMTELKVRLDRGQKLPPAFDHPEIRARLGIAWDALYATIGKAHDL